MSFISCSFQWMVKLVWAYLCGLKSKSKRRGDFTQKESVSQQKIRLTRWARRFRTLLPWDTKPATINHHLKVPVCRADQITPATNFDWVMKHTLACRNPWQTGNKSLIATDLWNHLCISRKLVFPCIKNKSLLLYQQPLGETKLLDFFPAPNFVSDQILLFH